MKICNTKYSQTTVYSLLCHFVCCLHLLILSHCWDPILKVDSSGHQGKITSKRHGWSWPIQEVSLKHLILYTASIPPCFTIPISSQLKVLLTTRVLRQFFTPYDCPFVRNFLTWKTNMWKFCHTKYSQTTVYSLLCPFVCCLHLLILPHCWDPIVKVDSNSHHAG